MAYGLRSSRLRTYVAKISAEAEAFFRTRWSEGSGTRDLLADLSELTIMTGENDGGDLDVAISILSSRPNHSSLRLPPFARCSLPLPTWGRRQGKHVPAGC